MENGGVMISPRKQATTAKPLCSFFVEEEAESMQASVAAVVVLYHPDPALFPRLIESIAGQVQKAFVVDNTPRPGGSVPITLEHPRLAISYHANGKNEGLAAAQNFGIDRAIREGFTHVLLLDQDSALPEDAVQGLLAAERSLLERGQQVAAVGPLFIDEKTGERSRGVRHVGLRVRWFPIPLAETQPVKTDYLIASGSLIRTSVLMHIGPMRDELFIDWVDTEWAYRASSAGYRNYIVPRVIMKHSVGDATGELLGKRFNLHSPVRNYYIVRNAVYLLRDRRMSRHWRMTMILYVPKYILVHSLLAQNRLQSFRQMLRAVWDGLRKNMRPLSQA
jgi:rhamnosyltransferase